MSFVELRDVEGVGRQREAGGPAAALTASPTGMPVRRRATTAGASGRAVSTTNTEFASSTFGSPSPGTRVPPTVVPSRASFEG